MEASPIEHKSFLQKNWHWVSLAAIILVIALLRIRLLSFPLERDEGEFGFVAQQILNGIPPFQETWNMKFPGTYYAYAVIIAVFGQTAESIHVGLMIVNLLTTVFLFLLTRKISGNLAAVVSALFWAFISLSPGVYGFAAHATQFVALFAVAGFYFLYKTAEDNNPRLLIYSGLLLGTSTLMKQSGFFFFLLGIIWLAWICISEKKLKLTSLISLSSGFLIPIIVVFTYFFAIGIFGNFWFWTMTYAYEYANLTALATGANNLWINSKWVLTGYNAFWIFVLPGFVSIFFLRGERQSIKRSFAFLFLLAGVATIIPG